MTAATISLLSIAAPQQSQLGFNGVSRLSIGRIASTKSSSNPICLHSFPQTSTSASAVAEEEKAAAADKVSPSPSSDALPSQSDPDSFPPSSGCKACGREEIEKGCNGEGRIQGGIATVPGFGWWPIKAYRPCPGFLASGGRYRRRGQSMDEVAFGREDRGASMATVEESKSRKKQGPRKFRR